MSETPMMRQYKEIKSRHQDEILFFRLGDFYEMFMDDAREASSILNLTLTARHDVPMCGIPYHAAKNYIKRLLDAGKKIAICEQTKLPDKGKGIAERDVIQVVTPGTVVDDDLLPGNENNFIMAIAVRKNSIFAAYADISTGEFVLTKVKREQNYENLRMLIARIHPVELLIQDSLYFDDDLFRKCVDQDWIMTTRFPDWKFDIKEAAHLLKEHFSVSTLQPFGISDKDNHLLAAGVLFSYLSDTAKKTLIHIRGLTIESDKGYMVVDESSQKNLELLRNMHDNTENFTLFSTIKDTKTAAGTRLLKRWILTPLCDSEKIEQRHTFVDHFYHDQALHNEFRKFLGKILDLERLCSRLSMQKASPRDLVSIRYSIDNIYSAVSLSDMLRDFMLVSLSPEDLTEMRVVSQAIAESINENINGPFSEGSVILDGYSSRLDTLRELKDNSVGYLERYTDSLIEETGIPKLKIKFNKIIGYFIEVSKVYSDNVPESFLRKQTLVNGERYTTEKLVKLERDIQSAQIDAENLERYLYNEILEKVLEVTPLIITLSRKVSELDVYQSFAYTALKYGYSKPVITDSTELKIINGRHPVVEKHLPPGEFVPNSLDFSQSRGRLALITGPNMSGKSTYLRQSALIVILAQIGSFIPADNAEIGLHDKIFCRVGATDNLARGESTFLVEMMETAYILRNATRRSLVIMDEVGRGTSTQDGVSIAFAVMKHVLNLGAKTLFATHYHELTVFENLKIQHLYLEVLEVEGKIIFRNKIKSGNAPSSYGLHAARLAGLPNAVIHEAEQYQAVHRKHEIDDAAELQRELDDLFTNENSPHDRHGESLLMMQEVIDVLDSVDIDDISARASLDLLYKLKEMIRK